MVFDFKMTTNKKLTEIDSKIRQNCDMIALLQKQNEDLEKEKEIIAMEEQTKRQKVNKYTIALMTTKKNQQNQSKVIIIL